MAMSVNKSTRWSGKRQAGFKYVNNASDVAILSMAVDSQPLFRRGVRRSLRRGENERIDDVFQALLSEPNRELASLLRDVRTESPGTLPGETRSQPVSKLLMRAAPLPPKQTLFHHNRRTLQPTAVTTGL